MSEQAGETQGGFQPFPKIGRLSREMVVTEKIDGTNAQVYIVKDVGIDDPSLALAAQDGLLMFAGSRTQWLSVEKGRDNFGFAMWVVRHAHELFALGEGRHFGEWWGGGIQRGYGLAKDDKRFSLFNTNRWGEYRDAVKYPKDAPACCSVVPVLHRGPFCLDTVRSKLAMLENIGSQAAPGFMKPEGLVVFHTATGTLFKKTIEKDEEPKGVHRGA